MGLPQEIKTDNRSGYIASWTQDRWSFGVFPLLLVTSGNIGSAEEIKPPGWHRHNMWLTWANATGVDSFCLSLAMLGDSFRTCLIGVPLSNITGFAKWLGAGGDPYVRAKGSKAENRWYNITKDGTKSGHMQKSGA